MTTAYDFFDWIKAAFEATDDEPLPPGLIRYGKVIIVTVTPEVVRAAGNTAKKQTPHRP